MSATYVDNAGVERYVRDNRSVASMRAARERWRKANPDKQNARNKKWRENNPDKQRASEKLWVENNQETYKAKNARQKFRRRSAVKNGSAEKINVSFLAELRKVQKDKCAYCLVELRGAGQLDHVHPVSAGGTHSRNNVVRACGPCNRKKSNKTGWRVNPSSNLLASNPAWLQPSGSMFLSRDA